MSKDSKIILFAAIAVVVLWVCCWLLLKDEALRGTFGDMFGAVNALFSGFAFLGVTYAILLQRTELSLQREELTLTRQELAKSAEAQQKSEIALSKQAEAMERTALITTLTTSLESLEKRMALIILSGQTDIVNQRKKVKNALQAKAHAITERLDDLLDDLLDETLLS
jgi:hypothetical protein